MHSGGGLIRHTIREQLAPNAVPRKATPISDRERDRINLERWLDAKRYRDAIVARTGVI